MGVPAFFRWLSKKYCSLVVHCVEEKPKEVSGINIPVDCSKPNPNDVEFDNLYLDMNGIIHPCCHPENKPAPKNEDEMMVLIFEYIDRIFSICRPRRLLYMAIDGVAPRAKMNQQRSRRFRAAKESIEKREEVARIKEDLRAKGLDVPPDKPAGEHFDSNCITPGTPFMFRLADCLRYYIHDRLNNDPGWQGIEVILSDANVPGEGEHKIMDYIRKQRAQPDHDPNTQHCLCGADADLIMLGLATHEPNFTIIREEFKPNQPRPCDICGQFGHEMKECCGLPKEKQGEHDELQSMGSDTEFIFIRLCVLREYLTKELEMHNLPFEQDIERAIDDWVFMCFFVGNDFLPHLPSLEIREGAIDRLIKIYKQTVHKTGGYLTKNGFVYLDRTQLILKDLGEVEDEIFKKRRESDVNFRRKNKMRRRRERQYKGAQRPSFLLGGQYAPQAVGAGSATISNPRQTAYQMRQQSNQMHSGADAAAGLKGMLSRDDQRGTKRKNPGEDSDSEPEPDDDVKLWEDGWKDRYYQNKFEVGENDMEFRHKVGRAYVLGLAWVLQYYYQGCASWKWYFPYHYAPFASDFVDIADVDINFPKDTAPIRPMEQLMSVFPAASKAHLPVSWGEQMEDPLSPIIDFYPINFKIDLNGKKYAWQGVALLPFVDAQRLNDTLERVYDDLTPEEKSRNVRGPDRMFISKKHPSYAFIQGLYEGTETTEPTRIPTEYMKGMACDVWCDPLVCTPGETFRSPLSSCSDLHSSSAIAVQYRDPVYDKTFVFPATMLPGAKLPEPSLKPEDWNQRNAGQQYRPQLGFQRNSHYRGRDNRNPAAAMRHVRAGLGAGSGTYSNAPPPLMGGGGYGGGGGGGGRGRDRDRDRGWERSSHGGASRGGRNWSDNKPYNRDNRDSGGRYGGGGGGGGYGGRGGYGGGGGSNNGRYSQDQSYTSGSRGGAGGWNRNLAGQQSAYNDNRGRYGQSSDHGARNYGNQDRGYGGGASGGGRGGHGGAGAIESYSTSRGRGNQGNSSSYGNYGQQSGGQYPSYRRY